MPSFSPMSLIGSFFGGARDLDVGLEFGHFVPLLAKNAGVPAIGLNPEWDFPAVQNRPFNAAIATRQKCHTFETLMVVNFNLQL